MSLVPAGQWMPACAGMTMCDEVFIFLIPSQAKFPSGQRGGGAGPRQYDQGKPLSFSAVTPAQAGGHCPAGALLCLDSGTGPRNDKRRWYSALFAPLPGMTRCGYCFAFMNIVHVLFCTMTWIPGVPSQNPGNIKLFA